MDHLGLLYFLAADDAEGFQSSVWQNFMFVWLALAWLVFAVAVMATAYTEAICTEYWCYSALWAAL